MIQISADNRVLTQGGKYSYLASNHSSSTSTLTIINSLGFVVDDHVLIGEWGGETSEIVKVSAVGTNTLTTSTSTKFSHPESTKVTIIKYDEVKFYHTATTTFSENENPLTVDADDVANGAFDIHADSFFTVYQDLVNSTGYGWFKFYNSTDDVVSSRSNYIPYGDFDSDTVKKIIDMFFSQLNNREQKLISVSDAFVYLREGYSILWNSLNLVNDSYSVTDEYSLAVTSAASEYDWPTLFSEIVSVTDSTGKKLRKIPIHEIQTNDAFPVGEVAYYLRSRKIGISPAPTASATYTIMYKTTAAELTSYTDIVQVPGKNYFPLVNFMLYKASPKLNRPSEAPGYYQLFSDGLDMMKLSVHSQDGGVDSFGITREALA